jgi:DNA-binding response OmpR family regulator
MKLTGSSLLLLEDEPLLRRRIGAHLEKDGVEVTQAATLAEAREALRNVSFDFALLDVNLPDGRSLSLLAEKEIPASVITIVMTAEGGVPGAVEAMRKGAGDYLVKPFDLEELAVRLASRVPGEIAVRSAASSIARKPRPRRTKRFSLALRLPEWRHSWTKSWPRIAGCRARCLR